MKTLLLGQAPGRSPGETLGGRIGRRLAMLAGVEDLSIAFDRENLLSRWPGKARSEKGDAFPATEARRAARALIPLLRGRRVVVLGVATARAFGLERPPLCRWFEACGALMAVVPHPSGVCRWWNDPSNVARARRILRAAARPDRRAACRNRRRRSA